MAQLTTLRVFQDARELTRMVRDLATDIRFGDLASQLQRATISIVSNIAEGAGSGSDRRLRNFLAIARGSANEVQAQLLILTDLGDIEEDHPSITLADRIGRQLTCFIKRLEPG